MSEIIILIVMGILTLVILWAGYRLSKNGQPYPGLLLNLHKLLALGTAVWLVVIAFGKGISPSLTSQQALVRTGAMVLVGAAILSGGVKSIPKAIPAIITTIHKVVPYLAIAGSGYFLINFLVR